ncbi:hypothetical protein GCM10007907_40060 [Chitinimonas prasina]|uniref:Uncharacterized protein n=1 Tax=Chitinimonas prasina TaxID=1434937 RepID=A0ABQ5YJP7_9NEIS|nr:hypothetical protein [Chitinimonas prasina]GLR15216.1 hypothetical protein GCM10007907_40060 [Chitinimonas prasina]
MADFPSLGPDTEPPAVVGKMDALIARHRGSGLNPNVPVLTDLDAGDLSDAIPVLTQVEPVVGDELMFTPEEIRGELPSSLDSLGAPPTRAAAPAPVAAPVAADPVAPSPRPAPAAPQVAAPVAPPPTAPAPPVEAARPASPAPSFEFPELTIPSLDAPPAKELAKPAVPQSQPHSPLADGPLMPELSLNFDFSPPPEEPRAAPAPAPAPAVVPAAPLVAAPVAPAPVVAATPQPVPAPAPAPAPVTPAVPATKPAAVPVAPVAPPTAPAVAPAAPVATASPPAMSPASPSPRSGVTVLVSDELPELSLELDEDHAEPAPVLDVAALAQELVAGLKPELERMVRIELGKQLAIVHTESLKRTLGALQPQLDKLIRSRIEDALKKR